MQPSSGSSAGLKQGGLLQVYLWNPSVYFSSLNFVHSDILLAAVSKIWVYLLFAIDPLDKSEVTCLRPHGQ